MNADTFVVAMGMFYFVGTYLHGVRTLGRNEPECMRHASPKCYIEGVMGTMVPSPFWEHNCVPPYCHDLIRVKGKEFSAMEYELGNLILAAKERERQTPASQNMLGLAVPPSQKSVSHKLQQMCKWRHV